MSFQTAVPPSDGEASAAIAISACLLGMPCRYDGSASPCEAVKKLAQRPGIEIVPICPETAGGLPRPRPPAEIVADAEDEPRRIAADAESERRIAADPGGGRRIVIDATGRDVTEAFETGARATLRLAQKRGCTHAILKAKSPSCGIGQVYDGTFTGTLIVGDGIAARLLMDVGIACIDERTFAELEEEDVSFYCSALT